MKRFTDNAGRVWTVEINVGAIKRVKSLLGINLLEAVEGRLIEQFIGDPVVLVDVLYIVCQPQAARDGVSDEDFGAAMAGDAIDAATNALLEDLVDFFPRRHRAVLRRAQTLIETRQKKYFQSVEQALNQMETATGGWSGGWRVWWASIRRRLRCASWFGWLKRKSAR